MAQAHRGVFISIEGGEGVGKSLFLNHLTSLLTRAGIALLASREPGGTATAERLREVFSIPPEGDSLTAESELFIISAARAQHVHHKIKPALQAGTWVLCDRFADSTYVYQGLLGGIEAGFLESVVAASTYGVSPDITFLLDCEVSLALSRLKNRQGQAPGGAQRYDEAAGVFHEQLRAAYLHLAKKAPERFVILDASLPCETVAAKAMAMLKARFAMGV